jgi:hypothetical protein
MRANRPSIAPRDRVPIRCRDESRRTYRDNHRFAFDARSVGEVLECNNDASQPNDHFLGNLNPLLCTNALNALHATSSNGGLSAMFTS